MCLEIFFDPENIYNLSLIPNTIRSTTHWPILTTLITHTHLAHVCCRCVCLTYTQIKKWSRFFICIKISLIASPFFIDPGPIWNTGPGKKTESNTDKLPVYFSSLIGQWRKYSWYIGCMESVSIPFKGQIVGGEKTYIIPQFSPMWYWVQMTVERRV